MNDGKSKIKGLDWASEFMFFGVLYLSITLLTLSSSIARAEQDFEKCGLLNFVESNQITSDEIKKFFLEKNCHVNEVASVLATTKNPILLNLTDGIETDFVNAKRAIFLLELGGDKEVAVSLLSAALVSTSELSDENAQNLRLFVFATLEDLREQLGVPKIHMIMLSIVSAYASKNIDRYEAFREMVPYCALLAIDIDSSFEEAAISSVYQTCASRKESPWRILTSI
ncbi:MAG: hypothetical protein ABJQ34_00965 [Paracoccaceae bacterium]|uniref:hypothetical protein n=1 Tax=Pseudophaeobacter sp. TaxID=1971739 RepID=UPI00329A58F8